MTATLTQFRIEHLHGKKDINIPIVDNRLVLVGENGAGKSTVANLIYYFLTRQWVRLRDYKFTALEATVSGTQVRITHDDLQLITQQGQGLRHLTMHFGPYRRRMLEDLDLTRLVDLDRIEEMTAQLSEEWEIPRSVVQEMLSRYGDELKKLPRRLADSIELLKSQEFGQFLYLPTYRRIEQDLKSIFRGIEIEEQVQKFRARIRKREKSAFVELIEFGMEDVEKTIAGRMAKIKESVRTGLNNLTGSYLRDVLRGLDNPTKDVAVLKEVDPKVFVSIFARIDETTLPASDKMQLERTIANLKQGYGSTQNEQVIAHFLSKLVALYREQQKSETDVRDFVQLCNAYLTGKSIVYDDVNYIIYIQQASNSGEKDEADKLELKVLSSGEKQIVSLFSHIYFSGDKNYFVIIDEPELSLSVPWQQRFLPDIINTGRCTGMIAVTHSPFIWENELEPYVRSLMQFIEPVHVLR